MKKITNVLVALFAIIALVGCNDPKDTNPSTFKLSETTVQVTNLGGSATVKLDAPGPWSTKVAEDSKAWLSVTPATGGGGSAIVITINSTAMADGQPTSGKITFSLVGGSGSVELTVDRVDAKPSRQTDSLALVALYNSMGGSKWALNRWNFTKPIRDWGGISTKLVDGEWRVFQIVLAAENLNGTIPDALGAMTELEFINLDHIFWKEPNTPKYLLTGPIPESVSKLPNLKMFAAAWQSLDGPINPAIFKPGLEYLVLSGNNIGGSIPQEVGQATNLKQLLLNGCKLTGPIPSTISNLTNLTRVQLETNRFTGEIPSFNASKKLSYIDLSMQSEMEQVSESYNDGVLDLDGNPRMNEYKKYKSGGFTGGAPSFTDMPDLTMVGFRACNITKAPVITNCPTVEVLALYDNPTLKQLDPSNVNLPKLKGLQVWNCGLTSLPDQINLPKLQELYLNTNALTSIPESFSSCTDLQFAYLNDNQLTSLPDVFDKLVFLNQLYVGHCKLTSVPASVWRRTSLAELELHNNELTEELPKDFTSFSKLLIFNVANNKMTGSILSLGTIRIASQVFAHNNQFSGNIPDGNITIDVEGTQIKPDIGRLAFVKYLTFDNNNIEGQIPASLQKCENLVHLRMNNNKLSGNIPESVVAMKKWCSFEPMTNIIPQQSPFTFVYTNNCK